jgi:hypothetical protein
MLESRVSISGLSEAGVGGTGALADDDCGGGCAVAPGWEV